MMKNRKRRALIWLLLSVSVLGSVVIIHFRGAQLHVVDPLLIENMVPGLIRDESWRRSIATDPKAHGYSAYGILEKRNSTVAVQEALSDLSHPDSYVWLNAAMYLGSLGEPVAVPYLIKGLRHRATRAHNDIAAQLQAITGQSYGKSQAAWKTWWHNQNPGAAFDFDIKDEDPLY